MKQFLIDYRFFFEAGAFLATIILAIVGLAGLYQLRLMKIDIRTRQDRKAKEKAIEAANTYLNEYCAFPMQKREIEEYIGEIGDFSYNSIEKNDDVFIKSVKRLEDGVWLEKLNKLESIAAIYASGVGDEKLGFQIIGRTYCSSVESHYDIISLLRAKNTCDYFENIVVLYQTWKPRLKKIELEYEINEKSEEVSTIKVKKIASINAKI